MMYANVSRRIRAFKPLQLIQCCFVVIFCACLPAQGQTPAPQPFGATPNEQQLEWHAMEYYGFIHFGINTFTGEEWGRSQSHPDVFNPTSLDTDQWAKTFKDAGMRMMILTAKHHDGMALWDTETTRYSVSSSAWAAARKEQGLSADIVRMAAESCEKHGLKFGLYLSPWDMSRDPKVKKGDNAKLVGDQIFGDANGTKDDDYGGNYNAYYDAQLTELVTMKISDGKGGLKTIEVGEVWLDGAGGGNQTYDFDRFRKTIRTHQPDAIMWGKVGDARWVGNEDGHTQKTNWHTWNQYDYGKYTVGRRNGNLWQPAEADARLDGSWFHKDHEKPKSVERLEKMYFETIGRSVTLLLNSTPDKTG